MRSNRILKNVGYLFIWGDTYLLFFFIHSLYVGPLDLGTHLYTYISIFVPLIEFGKSVHPWTEFFIDFVLGIPASPAYLFRFIGSTAIGIWLVRRYG